MIDKDVEATAQGDGELPSPKWEVASYDKVVGKADLVAVQAHDIKFKVVPIYFADMENNKFGYGIASGKVIFDVNTGIASVDVKAEITVKNKSKKLLSLSVDYSAIYVGLEDCDEGAVEAFLRRVGTFTCWPYFRTLAGNLDWSAGTRLPMLPVLREKVLPAKQEDKQRVVTKPE